MGREARQPAQQAAVAPRASGRSDGATATRARQPTLTRLQRSLGNHAFGSMRRSEPIQAKHQIGAPNDRFEQEADRVADRVMRMPLVAPPGISEAPRGLQRSCAACAAGGAPCATCGDAEEIQMKPLAGQITPRVQRRERGAEGREGAAAQGEQFLQAKNRQADGGGVAPPIVNEVLASPGQPLDSTARTFLGPRFGRNFGQVRVHSDTKAAQSARAINAAAYTVGRSIVFGQGQYRPTTPGGRQLLAHELTHVVQQGAAPTVSSADRLPLDSPHSSAEREARSIGANLGVGGSAAAARPSVKAQPGAAAPVVSRADPQSVAVTMNLGQTPKTGLQFWPTNVTDTQVGPVSVQGGLLSGRASRLNVIVGENLTLRVLARQLLPLWVTATPFTPPGAAAPLPLDIVTEEELAQGLLVYNRFFLPVPSMANWRAGLRFPLPVEIDEVTGMATLHPLQIRALAGAFDPAWAPLLDQRVAATVAPPAATLRTDATAFLTRETTALARGIHLGARALTNTVAELPFIQEVFRQLGAGSFDVAIAFMNSLVQRQIDLLAAQRDGAAILAEIGAALAAAPATPTAAQQADLARANLMLGRVAGVAAAAPPVAMRTRPEKTVTIDTVKLDGSNRNPASDVAAANAIFAQCNVRFRHVPHPDATPAQTTTWLGGDTNLRRTNSCSTVHAEERSLRVGATAAFALASRYKAFYVHSTTPPVRGVNSSPDCSSGPRAPFNRHLYVANSAAARTLAHELGHIPIRGLRDHTTHRDGTRNLMEPTNTATGEHLTDAQCRQVHAGI